MNEPTAGDNQQLSYKIITVYKIQRKDGEMDVGRSASCPVPDFAVTTYKLNVDIQ
jgi:hypothetical protein